MFLTNLVRKKSLGARTLAGVKGIMGGKTIAGAVAVAVAGAAIPIALAVRKRLNVRAVQLKLSEAKEAARKVPHAAKPRKARRIARHLAKTLGPAAGTGTA